VRLLLDEHYSSRIAVSLRERGHEVVAVRERADLRGLDDRQIWARAAGETRALVTENAADFMPLFREAAAAGAHHFGVVFTSPRSLPRSAGTIGVYAEELDRFLRERPADDALADLVHWLGSG
jgi:Domain of unknown function (DUF5615)